MSISLAAAIGARYRALLGLLIVALVAASPQVAHAQNNNANVLSTRAVGGVLINPEGLLTNATVTDLRELRDALAEQMQVVPDGLDRAAEMRKVSLRRLEQTIRQCLETGQNLPDDVFFLGGLQQIQYILVYPEQRDIVLVGPGEGWTTNARGAVVGQTTGRPVLLLDDLLVALRSAAGPTRSVISCSIDPTPEGIQRLTVQTRKMRGIRNPQAAARSIEQTLGPQQVSIEGVPHTSHYARVLIAADYRMKRIGMKKGESPVAGLPSFPEMIQSGRARSNLPRWWLAPDYQPLARDAEGLAWEIRGASVKAMAENDFLDAHGARQRSGKADPISQRWADLMTRRYDDLAKVEPVFGQLRNCMDLAIVAALMAKENLAQRAELSLPMLMGAEGALSTMQFNAPRQIPSEASLTRIRQGWLVAAGGVQINPWELVDRVEQVDALASVRSLAMPANSNQWWSN